ncbi:MULTISPECIES: glycosyltransferase 87 family protein [unclassified Streptomyces]|uniref:glycosyltransferase 87 family protein n=1 Tax=unclassified Streptomyces TaxID=2593676 RepID=UPI002E290B80|nr:glycosyltransferase 87 family protein [Streptomyces sp. NBC_01429]
MLALSLAALVVLCLAGHVPMADALVYRAEGAAVVGGTDIYGADASRTDASRTDGQGPDLYGPAPYGTGHYGSHPYGTGLHGAAGWQLSAGYPPFAAILFVPTTWLPVGALKIVLLVGNAALFALLVRLSWRFAALSSRMPLARVPRPAPVAGTFAAFTVAVAGGLWLEPVLRTMLFGQISLALACLVLWDLSRPEHALGKGFALGIAAGIILTPAVFLGYLLLTGRVRAGLTALAALTGTVLLGMLVLPQASGEFWTRHVFETGIGTGAGAGIGTGLGTGSGSDGAWAGGSPGNQSLYGLLAHVPYAPEPGAWWVAAGGLTAVGGLWIARRAVVRARSETWGVLTAALTALLVAPVSWTHHWVWCVPLLAVLIAERRFRVAAAAGVVWTAGGHLGVVPRAGEPDLRLPWWQQPLTSLYALSALGLLVYVAWRTRIRTSAGAVERQPTAVGLLPAPRTDAETVSSP